VDADVVPAYRYRDYSQDFLLKATNYVGGIEIRPDSGGRIINYPEQHIRLGRKKNTETSYYYKKMVRIMKSLKEDMLENRKSLPASISSFGIESLLWNVPNKEYVQYTSMGLCFSNVLVKLRADLVNFSHYKEANGIKPLFPSTSMLSDYQKFVLLMCDYFRYSV